MRKCKICARIIFLCFSCAPEYKEHKAFKEETAATNTEDINSEVQKVSEEPSKKIILTVNRKLLTELYKQVGRHQFINSILAEYVNSHHQSVEDGYHVQA